MATEPNVMRSLTPKQSRFIQEYLVDLNGTQAAIRAGYAESGARTEGARLLANANIQEALVKAKAALAERVSITQDEVIREYKRIAFFDIARLCNEDGDPLKVHELDEDTRRAIAGLEIQELYQESLNTGRVKKYKIASKLGALDSLARHLGMFHDKVDLTSGGEPIKALISVNIDDV